MQPTNCEFVTTPWGGWRVISDGGNWKVKMLTIVQGEAFSLQTHKWRDERWLVVEGCGVVTLGDEEFIIRPGQMLDVPRGVPHRIRAQFPNMIIVEVQTGNACAEDDIVRLADDYGRT